MEQAECLRSNRLQTSPPPGREQSISHQHRYRHQTHAAGYGRAQPGDSIRFGWVNVANQSVTALSDHFHSLFCFVAKKLSCLFGARDFVDADVDYCRSRLDEVAANECGPAHRGHKNVRLTRD